MVTAMTPGLALARCRRCSTSHSLRGRTERKRAAISRAASASGGSVLRRARPARARLMPMLGCASHAGIAGVAPNPATAAPTNHPHAPAVRLRRRGRSAPRPRHERPAHRQETAPRAPTPPPSPGWSRGWRRRPLRRAARFPLPPEHRTAELIRRRSCHRTSRCGWPARMRPRRTPGSEGRNPASPGDRAPNGSPARRMPRRRARRSADERRQPRYSASLIPSTPTSMEETLPRISSSILPAISALALKKSRAFSRPCPSRVSP